MTAAEAIKATESAARRAERARIRDRKKKIADDKQRLAWAKKRILPEIRKGVLEAIKQAADIGHYRASYHHQGEERELGEIVAKELRAKGYSVRVEAGVTESTHDGDSGWMAGRGYLNLHIEWVLKK